MPHKPLQFVAVFQVRQLEASQPLRRGGGAQTLLSKLGFHFSSAERLELPTSQW